MEVFTKGGKHSVILNDTNFLTNGQGGFGKVHKIRYDAYKIFFDKDKAISEKKIEELSHFENTGIVKPKELLYDNLSNVVGYKMDFIDGYQLCQLYSNSFRNKNGLEPKKVVSIVEELQKIIVDIHDKNCLVIDLKDENIITSKKFFMPYIIDVDSFQTTNFPADAFTPLTKDWISNKFSEVTDWYSFAIVTFQLFVGIHPYRGRHPKYGKNTLERMKHPNSSVINREVTLPKLPRNFSMIPSTYLEWYEKLFEKGERILPPNVTTKIREYKVKTEIFKGTDNLIIKLVKEHSQNIKFYREFMGNNIIVTTGGTVFLGREVKKADDEVEGIVFSEDKQIPIAFYIEKGDIKKLNLKSLDGNYSVNSTNFEVNGCFLYNGKLFTKAGDKFVNISFIETENKLIPKVILLSSVMETSSKVFDGLIIQNMVGKICLTLPGFRKDNIPTVKNIFVEELEEYKIIDAKYHNKVCIVTTTKNGIYYKHVIIFDNDFLTYKIRRINDILNYDVNFTVLNKGLVLHICDGKMEIFSNDISSDRIKEFRDDVISSDMILCNNGDNVYFYQENKLCQISMRKKS